MSDNAPDSPALVDPVLSPEPTPVVEVSAIPTPVESLEKALGLSDGQSVTIWPKGDGGIQVDIPGYIIQLSGHEVGSAGNDLRGLIISKVNEARAK